MEKFIKYKMTLVTLLLLSSCTIFFKNDTQVKELEEAIFRSNNTREYYKIVKINKKSEKDFGTDKIGDLEGRTNEFLADIDVEVKKNCYEMFSVKNDILPLCSSGDKPEYKKLENLKKIGTTVQLKDIKIRIQTIKDLKIKKDFKNYTVEYKNQTYYQF